MEDLQQRHRKETKDLQSRITQKKKNATKKTRKHVNDECAELEKDLKERQACELADVDGGNHIGESGVDESEEDIASEGEIHNDVPKAELSVAALSDIQTNGHAKKPNRQKARLARRAAEQEAAAEQAEKEAVSLPNLRDRELASMQEAYQAKGLYEHDIKSDGHCLYAAIADQLNDAALGLKPRITLELNGVTKPHYVVIRHVAAAYIAQNSDDFTPFLEQPLDKYLKTIRDTGEWGGHLEILALAKVYGVDIKILHGNGHVDHIESGFSNHKPLWLAYYRHRYRLGEHYNSLRRSK